MAIKEQYIFNTYSGTLRRVWKPIRPYIVLRSTSKKRFYYRSTLMTKHISVCVSSLKSLTSRSGLSKGLKGNKIDGNTFLGDHLLRPKRSMMYHFF